jgi:hypothetical protein
MKRPLVIIIICFTCFASSAQISGHTWVCYAKKTDHGIELNKDNNAVPSLNTFTLQLEEGTNARYTRSGTKSCEGYFTLDEATRIIKFDPDCRGIVLDWKYTYDSEHQLLFLSLSATHLTYYLVRTR